MGYASGIMRPDGYSDLTPSEKDIGVVLSGFRKFAKLIREGKRFFEVGEFKFLEQVTMLRGGPSFRKNR